MTVRSVLLTAVLSACVSSPTAPSHVGPYHRADWSHWVDADGDCQDTRAEVLIDESLVPVTFTDARQCLVADGWWLDLYAGVTYVRASDLDIDHLVPLAEAHASGGAAWSREQKRAYANDLTDPWHLVAVGAGVNRRKGARRPDQWMPPDRAAWCDYAAAWQRVKARWQLRTQAAEDEALREMLATC